MERVQADDPPALHNMVNGFRRDIAAFSPTWSSGQVEGQVTRTKQRGKHADSRTTADR
ncbi:hypothetical protein GCM10010278_82650 [Streptomyces melanogenes]|nr:hypothetical protein GCM10010278_82650 [Streptomyces melanogenes]